MHAARAEQIKARAARAAADAQHFAAQSIDDAAAHARGVAEDAARERARKEALLDQAAKLRAQVSLALCKLEHLRYSYSCP